MAVRNIVAVDLGASSGRVMLAQWHSATQKITLQQVHRFPNTFISQDGQDCWDLDRLEREILSGLTTLDNAGTIIDGIGIDTWGVDYVLLDERGGRVTCPVSYRDHRTDGIMAGVARDLGREHIYQLTGIQFLSFNTLYQLKAWRRQQPERLGQVAHLLMIADYFYFRLTGTLNWEYTNASTTQLLNLATRDWDQSLLDYLDIPRGWLGKPTPPGNMLGHWISPGGRAVPAIAVATHDTASAVVGAPLHDDGCAYLSSGTWSLIGLDSDRPFNDAAALAMNITNEGGVDGRYRVLKNIMGLWLLQRVCAELAVPDLEALLADAAGRPACASLINPNDERFINPRSMVDAIRQACREHQQPVPEDAASLARCIFDSLAMLYRQALLELGMLRGAALTRLYIVGGGCRNHLLNQLCADSCRIPVTAGPVEASTLGNIGCQLMALGEVTDVAHWRGAVEANFPLRHYSPDPDPHFATHWQRFLALCHLKEEIL
ncbi:rhamnulokinase [Acerihabitans arboris]|uniref:Rhamnulokinase n=1 Tax=Acerihabitans arboris TaxID=2691583 RepID=A0A845SMQ9_9GAMM|nr:rhamnulokinase [Acerihabitans arboris]NDL64214.1 rhamnulokinase [Acerihabitans arboris]